MSLAPLVLADAGATERAGRALAGHLAGGDVIALRGPLGAGKTSLARGILHGLGHAGEVPSPTFTLVQTYDAPPLRLPVWHVDLYRLGDRRAVEELGLTDAPAQAVLLIEWPERLDGAWPQVDEAGGVWLDLAATGEGRALSARAAGCWQGRLANVWRQLAAAVDVNARD